MAFLRATKGLEPGRVCDLQPGAIIVGRNPSRCDVVLEHFAVSREHARLETLGEATFIEDLGSRNGVWVNGRQLDPGPGGRIRLNPLDRISIAAFEFIFEADGSGERYHILADETATPEVYSTVDVSCDSSYDIFVGEDEDSRADKLRTVLTIIEELANTLDIEIVMPRVIDCLFRSFPQAQNGFVLLRDREKGGFLPAAMRRLDASDEEIRVSRTIMDYVVTSRKAVLSGDVASDARFVRSASVRELNLRSMISAPLVDSCGNVGGMIQLEVVDGGSQFTQEDLELLAGVARHISTVIENSRLHDAALKAQRLDFEQRFRKLIEGSVQGILIHRDFKPLFVNEAWARLHGTTVDEVTRMMTILPLITEEDRARVVGRECSVARSEAGRLTDQFKPLNAATAAPTRQCETVAPEHFEIRAQRPDGSTVWLEVFSTVVEWDGGPATQWACIDLTDRKRAEEVERRSRDELEQLVTERSAELAASEALYRSLVDHLPLCVARRNLEGQFTFVNRAFCRLLALAEEQVVGTQYHDILPDLQARACQQHDLEVIRSGEPKESFETIRAPRDGEVRHMHTIRTPLHDADGRVVGTQLICWDITSLKESQEARNRYAKELERSNRDLEQFAYSVSHDLQSPLRTVTSYCQLLEKRYLDELGDEARELLEGAIAGAKRMKRLLSDLLTYSRVTTEGQQLQPTDASQALEEALKNLRAAIEESGAEVIHDPLPTVISDPTQLMQVFQNLVGNAIRYRSEAPPRVRIECDELPDCWRFSVSDNGVGIDPRHFERIFLIFQRLYAEHELSGSGVGLAICKRIVERHSGRIWVESRPGEGATFLFTLAKPQAGAASRLAM